MQRKSARLDVERRRKQQKLKEEENEKQSEDHLTEFGRVEDWVRSLPGGGGRRDTRERCRVGARGGEHESSRS